MVSFPNAKINLGLQILGKRPDGFHDLQTIFYPVRLRDALEIFETTDNTLSFTSSGLKTDGSDEDNLCVRAYRLLKKDFPDLPGFGIHLLKHIPMGAGLGGGSADASFMLRMINQKYRLKLTADQLSNYALTLGSDCPFFLINQPCLATGRGEILDPVEIDLSHYCILLINPGIHVNTGWAFKSLQIKDNHKDLKSIINRPVKEWRDEMRNDFEEPVFKEHPEIGKLKQDLYDAGAIFASLSGSGSTVFGIFEKKPDHELTLPDHYFSIWI
jgi:4-diphosphocytidyl-2-C-methyl-D-erythritol kinase